MSRASERVTFAECVATCLAQPSFVAAWARLRGFKLTALTPLDMMIDDATGHADHVARTFIEDVKDIVWDRLPEDLKA